MKEYVKALFTSGPFIGSVYGTTSGVFIGLVLANELDKPKKKTVRASACIGSMIGSAFGGFVDNMMMKNK